MSQKLFCLSYKIICTPGMGMQIMQDIAHSHVGATPPRSPSQNSVNKVSQIQKES